MGFSMSKFPGKTGKGNSTKGAKGTKCVLRICIWAILVLEELALMKLATLRSEGTKVVMRYALPSIISVRILFITEVSCMEGRLRGDGRFRIIAMGSLR